MLFRSRLGARVGARPVPRSQRLRQPARAGSVSRLPCAFRTRCAPGRRALHKLEVFFSLDFDDEAHQIPSVYSMSKRRQNALFVVVGLASAAILISALRRREPVSEGKKLGEAAAKAGVK